MGRSFRPSKLVLLVLIVSFFVSRRRGDPGDRVGEGGISESFFVFGDLGDLGERETFDGKSSMLSRVLTLRESSETFGWICAKLSDAVIMLPCSFSDASLGGVLLTGEVGVMAVGRELSRIASVSE